MGKVVLIFRGALKAMTTRGVEITGRSFPGLSYVVGAGTVA